MGQVQPQALIPLADVKPQQIKKVLAVRMSYSLEMHMNIHGGGAFRTAECSCWRAT